MEGTIFWILEQLKEEPGVNTAKHESSVNSEKKNETMIGILKAKNTVFKEKYILTLSPPPPLIQITSLTAKFSKL